MVRLYLLGDLRLEVDGTAVVLPPSRKARLLLTMLALERRVHGRSELAGRLWPDVGEDSARGSLRTALAQLRRALGSIADDVLHADAVERVALATGVWTDVDEVDRLLDAGRPEDALNLCTAQLLAGADEDWVHEQRDHLRMRLSEGLANAGAAAEAAGDVDAAVRASRHLTALEPLAETPHRDLIRRLAASADRAAALASYERFRERLWSELQIAPSTATRTLVEHIRTSGDARSPAGDLPATAALTNTSIGPSRVRYARSTDRSIAYQRFGSGRLNLLVVPGWASNLDAIWDFPPLGPLLLRLGEWARCTVFDKRGTGLSERDLDFGSLEERAADIGAVMDAAEIERAALFAYSESAALALLFAAEHPERVERLVLYSSYARLTAGPDYPSGFPPEIVDAFVEQIGADWGQGTITRVSIQGAPETDAAAEMLGRWERSLCTPTMAAHIIRRNADIDIRSLLATVTVPTLVLHSTGDPICPPELGRYVAEHVPGARYVEREAAYHLPWHGEDAWFLEETKEFLTAEHERSVEARSLATVLVASLVGPAPPSATLDQLIVDEVKRSGGELKHTVSGELVGLFDSPSRSLACAASIRAVINRQLGTPTGFGVHAGEVERRDDVGGPGLAVARQLAAMARPGEIVVSRTVRDLTAGSSLAFSPRGRTSLPGIADDWDVFTYETDPSV